MLTMNSTSCYPVAAMSTFGQSVKKLRQNAGLTQRELAAKIDVDFSYISKLENNKLPPPAPETIERIAKELDCAAETLLAIAKRAPAGTSHLVGSSTNAIEFLKTVREMRLTEEEWANLTSTVKRLRE